MVKVQPIRYVLWYIPTVPRNHDAIGNVGYIFFYLRTEEEPEHEI